MADKNPNCRIRRFMICKQCFAELPPDESMETWSRLNFGPTPWGFQLWCVRHQKQVIHLDMLGQVASTLEEDPQEPEGGPLREDQIRQLMGIRNQRLYEGMKLHMGIDMDEMLNMVAEDIPLDPDDDDSAPPVPRAN